MENSMKIPQKNGNRTANDLHGKKPASWETCMQVRKQQLELDREQQTGSKEEKEYTSRLYIVTLLI